MPSPNADQSHAAKVLASAGRSIPAQRITVQLVDPDNPTRVADAHACLRFVPDRVRFEALDDAAGALAAIKVPVDDRRRAGEETYHFLVRALRQAEQPSAPFFQTALEAKNMLTTAEAMRIANEYDRYLWAHAPQTMTPEQIAEVRKDVEGFFLPDLLRRHGYWSLARLLPSLAMELGISLIPTS